MTIIKPRIKCYRVLGIRYWSCVDEYGCYGVGSTPMEAWESYFNREIPF
ncbi:hypothetical protein G169_gp53 [Pseudomonas phage AF]|nr:hypothetical protein G169_gp53 [Pseudomonas phage AF]AFV50666.1 hypothetical protein AF_053 [Pseudomonas phage AF]